MAKLTTKARRALPPSAFGLPKERKFPVENASHAANAKARAKQQLNDGNLSGKQYAGIIRKADKKLGK